MIDTPLSRPRRPIYLADLFFEFRVYAERVFSAEGRLRRIEQAKSLSSSGMSWIPDENRVKHRHAYERQQLRTGLALYLFDRFLHAESGRLDCILVETGAGQFQSVGAPVFTKIGDLYLGRIDHWRNVRYARQQLLEIAGQYGASYPLVDTTHWAVNDLTTLAGGIGVQDEDEFQHLIAAREQVVPYSGLPLWFRGPKPSHKMFGDLLGNTTWLESDYIAELAQDLYRHFRLLSDSKLFQQDAANYLGIEKNTRTFTKIWRAFREKLTPQEQTALPRRGEKKSRLS